MKSDNVEKRHGFIESVEGENIEEEHIYDITCPNCENRVDVYREYIGNLFAQDVYKCNNCNALGYIFRGVIHHKNEKNEKNEKNVKDVKNVKLDEHIIKDEDKDEAKTTYALSIDNNGEKELTIYDTMYGNGSVDKLPEELYYGYEDVDTDDDIICGVCEEEFDHFDKFLMHIISEHSILEIVHACYQMKEYSSCDDGSKSDRVPILTENEFEALQDAKALNEYHSHFLTHLENKLKKYVEGE